MKKFWDIFYKKPLNQIPWQQTQADWFKQLVDNGEFTGKTILDLGCGTGQKSIYLVQHAKCEKVIGIDISEQAILYAKQNAQNANVSDQCSFIVRDITEWNFLKEDKIFDCILDWATIHTIPRERLTEYAKNISNHCKKNGLFLLRSFSSNTDKQHFVEKTDGLESKILLLSQQGIEQLFSDFQILKTNTSQPRTKSNIHFIEILFMKK
jgi:cyclopropane fatty-acyl-phospholipid synthase-like methyltransferase